MIDRIILFGGLLFFLLPLPYAQQVRDTSITLFFAPNVYSLDSDQVKKLETFSLQIDSVENIIGYADSIGTIKYNQQLSKLRAENVYRTLLSFNLKIANVPLYRGEEFPQNADLSKNRKVEVTGYPLKNHRDLLFEDKDSIVKVFDIENVYFIPDKPIITQESIPYIQQLARILKSYRNHRFEIIGHVNYQSRKDSSYLKDLYKLSEERAKTIYNQLIDEGILASQLTYKGVGNSQPAIKNPQTDEERGKNMRVQIIIHLNASPSK